MANVSHVEFDLSLQEAIPLFTIAVPVHGVGKYVCQTRCPSDVAIVSLRIEPYTGLNPYMVEWAVDESLIPRRFMSAVVDGIKIRLEQFAQKRSIINIKIIVVDGMYHEIDSREHSYRVAAGLAFDDAMEKAYFIAGKRAC
jgi:elongation factor G